MGYLILAAVGLVAAYLAIWLLVAGFLLFYLPGLVVAVPATVGLGVLLAVVTAVRAVVAGGPVITPEMVADGKAGLPELRGNNPFGRDRAWPSYLVAQGRTDLRRVWTETVKAVRRGWKWISDFFDNKDFAWVPGLLLACPLWLGVSVGALAGGAAIVLAGGLVLFAIWVPWALLAGFLRGGDQLVRRLRGASPASCPHCHHVSPLPVFRCAGCGQTHRDIRPGRLGGVWRRCDCGRRLPTTVLRMALRTTPECPRCGKSMRAGTAALTEIRVPVFGPVSAGKTRLVYAGIMALRDALAATGGRLDFVDDESELAFENGSAIITGGTDTVKTPAGEVPGALTVRLTTGRRRALLHLFDAAGEIYVDREENSGLEFLDHAQGMVFVVDPFSVPWVRDQLGEDVGLIARANPASEDPERVYHVTAQRLREYRVDTRKRRLAVTVVKADLLAGLPLASDLSPARCKEWLNQAGLDNLVLAAERDFGEVRYFVTASVSGIPAGDARSPGNPLGWLAGLTSAPVPGVPDGEKETV
ncbi:MAG TPA: hypothetical protein VJT49_25065 [Amycolatopsis sp.]|uniref:TRAFAC clade GTPase domain-containing protein n=1 Tax=Amycolatopsis sp. TaxID=37632 RepID=UPI002B471B4F|nr:hypothetical protein [Amycolatopsis sp.]HKS48320.1 hypothetical protein [Amycolatopsis sp.]